MHLLPSPESRGRTGWAAARSSCPASATAAAATGHSGSRQSKMSWTRRDSKAPRTPVNKKGSITEHDTYILKDCLEENCSSGVEAVIVDTSGVLTPQLPAASRVLRDAVLKKLRGATTRETTIIHLLNTKFFNQTNNYVFFLIYNQTLAFSNLEFIVFHGVVIIYVTLSLSLLLGDF